MKPIINDKFTPQQKVFCVGGSPRKGGNSDFVLDLFAKQFKKNNSDCEIVKLREYSFDPCIGCEQCRKGNECLGHKDGMTLLYPNIILSKGLVLVSPTHHYNITSWMKAFIDRMYCFYNFGNDLPRSWSSQLAGQGRIAALVAICEQKDKKDMGFTLEAMRWPLEAFGYQIIDELAVFKIFKKGGIRENEHAIKRVAEIAEKMSMAI